MDLEGDFVIPRTCQAALAAPVSVFLLLVAAMPAAAQFSETEQTLWGVSASFVPNWTAPESFKMFHRADEVNLSGSAFRIGVTRGTWLGGDSGWSFFRQHLKTGSSLEKDGARYRTGRATTLSGVQYHRFAPFTTIRERIQVGILVAAGFGWYRGTVTRNDEEVEASGLSVLARDDEDNRWVPAPMMKLAGAATVLAGAGVKGRVTFGYGLFTGREIGFDIVYLVGGG